MRSVFILAGKSAGKSLFPFSFRYVVEPRALTCSAAAFLIDRSLRTRRMNRHWMGGSRKRVTERKGSKMERQQRAYFEANRKPVVQRRLSAPTTRVAPVSSDELLAVAPRQRSLDLLMLAGPYVLPPTKKHELSSNDAVILKANELSSTSSPQDEGIGGKEGRSPKRPRKDVEVVSPAKPGSDSFKVPTPRPKPNFYLSRVSQPQHKGTPFREGLRLQRLTRKLSALL
jgi:hypothetical protein